MLWVKLWQRVIHWLPYENNGEPGKNSHKSLEREIQTEANVYGVRESQKPWRRQREMTQILRNEKLAKHFGWELKKKKRTFNFFFVEK